MTTDHNAIDQLGAPGDALERGRQATMEALYQTRKPLPRHGQCQTKRNHDDDGEFPSPDGFPVGFIGSVRTLREQAGLPIKILRLEAR